MSAPQRHAQPSYPSQPAPVYSFEGIEMSLLEGANPPGQTHGVADETTGASTAAGPIDYKDALISDLISRLEDSRTKCGGLQAANDQHTLDMRSARRSTNRLGWYAVAVLLSVGSAALGVTIPLKKRLNTCESRPSQVQSAACIADVPASLGAAPLRGSVTEQPESDSTIVVDTEYGPVKFAFSPVWAHEGETVRWSSAANADIDDTTKDNDRTPTSECIVTVEGSDGNHYQVNVTLSKVSGAEAATQLPE